MEKISYIATITGQNRVKVSLCKEVPDFIHAVKFNHDTQFELIFDADSDWTPQLEDSAMNMLAFSTSDLMPVKLV